MAMGRDIFKGPMPDASEMTNINAMNFDPSSVQPSVPGKLREDKPNADRQQRGQSNFKGADSNEPSNANKEFSHHYFD
eukprot:6624151-Alexandrium_andersonii.AAC.1